MSRDIYDNWEKLVSAVVKKQQLWDLFHQQSRSPSICSETSDSSQSYSLHSCVHDVGSPRLKEAFAIFQPKLVSVSNFSPPLNAEDVLLASTELLGRGTFGSVYTATMENGERIVVRRLKPGITSELEFKRNMEIVRNIRHENVVALRAYYSSRDEKLVLYDHYSQGSVYSLLHGRTDEKRAQVYWKTRMRIAIGVARGIDEIHTQDDGKFVHGNVKASNIFINSEGYGCISDLGLPNMVSVPFLPTAWCYAPEVKNTQPSDVYSFGILIFELLTRKSPAYIPDGPHAVDLVKLVTSIKSKEWAVKVFDADLLKNREIKDKMLKVLQIGVSCVAKSPKKRPKMSAVVKMLENIDVNVTRSSVPVQKFVNYNIPRFKFDDMLKARVEVLGKGTFGTSYKAVLRNGDIIRVKRMMDLSVTLEEFQQHIDVTGRMRHKNVGEPRAYFYLKDEKLSVYQYDHHYQSSVSTMLHGKRTDNSDPLDWDARLKIAIGAARGIAYIHQQDRGTFVHGNIRTTNIFLNQQKFGRICDCGLAKLFGPLKPSDTPSSDSYAPEVTNTGRIYQASDVYSFGIVLLELVSGKPFDFTVSDGNRTVSLVKWIQVVPREKWTNEVLDIVLATNENDLETMKQFLQIGLNCVASAPEDRPKMTQVVSMLEEIGGVCSVEQISVESKLECLLEDLLPTMKL